MKTLFKFAILTISIFANSFASQKTYSSSPLFQVTPHSYTICNTLMSRFYTVNNGFLPLSKANDDNVEWQSITFEYYGTNLTPISITTTDFKILNTVQKLSGKLSFSSPQERLEGILDICQKHVDSLPVAETQLPSIFDILFDVLILNSPSALENYGIFANVKIIDQDKYDKLDLISNLSGIVFKYEAEECVKNLQVQFLKSLPVDLKKFGETQETELNENFQMHRYFDAEDTISNLGFRLPIYSEYLGKNSELGSLWQSIKGSFSAFPEAVKNLFVSIQLLNYIYGFDFLLTKS